MPTDGKYVEGATPVVREYIIRGTRYIVNATVNEGASEDATVKVRRLIRNEISQTSKSLAERQTSGGKCAIIKAR